MEKDPLLETLWREGIAVWGTVLVNPDLEKYRFAQPYQLVISESGMIPLRIKHFFDDAKKYISTEGHSVKEFIYNLWFARNTMDGYILGSYLVSELSKKYSLKELMKWDAQKVEREIRPVLHALYEFRYEEAQLAHRKLCDSFDPFDNSVIPATHCLKMAPSESCGPIAGVCTSS